MDVNTTSAISRRADMLLIGTFFSIGDKEGLDQKRVKTTSAISRRADMLLIGTFFSIGDKEGLDQKRVKTTRCQISPVCASLPPGG